MLGGVAAFAGVLVVGPRIGKYGKNGTAKSSPGHSVTLDALGVFIRGSVGMDSTPAQRWQLWVRTSLWLR
jgi:hypothetical protein